MIRCQAARGAFATKVIALQITRGFPALPGADRDARFDPMTLEPLETP